MSEEFFNKALSNFVKDFACTDEVIAKFNNKKPISQIVRELTFRISESDIIQMIWNYLIEKNIVLMYEINDEKNKQYDIVKKVGQLGKITYEKVNKGSIDIKDYQVVDINKLLSDKEYMLKLNDFQKELITKLPWGNREYYIKKDFFDVIKNFKNRAFNN